MVDRHPRAIMIAGILVWAWLVLTLSGTGIAAAVTTMGDLDCEADIGDSNYGEMQWSFAPPARTASGPTKSTGSPRPLARPRSGPPGC